VVRFSVKMIKGVSRVQLCYMELLTVIVIFFF